MVSSIQDCCSLPCLLINEHQSDIVSVLMARNHTTQTGVMLPTPEPARDTRTTAEPWVHSVPALLKPITQRAISRSFKEQLSLASPAKAKPSAQHWGTSGSVGTLQHCDSTNPAPPYPDALGFNWRGDNRMEAVGKKRTRFSVPDREQKSYTAPLLKPLCFSFQDPAGLPTRWPVRNSVQHHFNWGLLI